MNIVTDNAQPLHNAPRKGPGDAVTSEVGDSGLDALTYDLVTILHAKSKSLECYARYLRHAERNSEARQLLEQIRADDLRNVVQLRECLAKELAQSNGRSGGGEAVASTERRDRE